MTKKQVTPKNGDPKSQKKSSAKIPQPLSFKIDKPTLPLMADSTEVVRPV